MSYTTPQQWLAMLRSHPNQRVTSFRDSGPGGILDATGGFATRSSVNPNRDWRTMLADFEAINSLRQPSGGPQAQQQLTGPRNVREALAMAPGSFVAETDSVAPWESDPFGTTPPIIPEYDPSMMEGMFPGSRATDANAAMNLQLPGQIGAEDGPQGFFSRISSYFGENPEVLGATAARMSEVASQPGASFLQSLNAGIGAGVQQSAVNKAAQTAQERYDNQLQLARLNQANTVAAREATLRLMFETHDVPTEMQTQLIETAGDEKAFTEAVNMLQGSLDPDPTSEDLERGQFEWFASLPEAKQDLFLLFKRNPPAQTTINTGDTVTPQSASEAAMADWVTGLYDMRQIIETQTLPGLQNIDQTLAIVNHERFPEISGVLRGNAAADVVTRVRGDAELLGMLGAFERLGQERTLQILANFTGAKSNYELDMAQKMAQGDRSMTPDEMRDALELMRKAYVQEAVRWARDIQNLAPIEGEFADVNAGFRVRAQNILDQYDEEERGYSEFVDPLGIGRGPGG